jgi:hypothetical protein
MTRLLQKKAQAAGASAERSLLAPASLRETLDASAGRGRPLDPSTRTEMGSRFGFDFSTVRVYTGPGAHAMNESIHARAFTHGHDIYFRRGEYDPRSAAGKNLLAHELTHVLQDNGARGMLHPMLLYPEQPKQAAVTDVFIEGGLIDDASKQRASAIVEAATTIRSIAKTILPWFTKAKPSATTTAPVLTVDQMAQALMVFNEGHLQMTADPATSFKEFRVGMRFPLPVLIDTAGEWQVNPAAIEQMASRFDPAWKPFLDQKPKAASIPTDIGAEVDEFLKDYPTTSARAVRLEVLTFTNPTEALPIVQAVFARSGTGHELAIELMNGIVNHQVGLLASLPEGHKILQTLFQAVSTAPSTSAAPVLEAAKRALGMLQPHVVPKLAANPTTVAPRGTGGAETSKITITGLAPNAAVAAPAVTAVSFSGGHQHDDNRPAGTITPARKTADRSGSAEFVYRSNVPGGEEVVAMTAGGQTTDVHIEVRIPGLVELATGPEYDLTGSTAEHQSPANHFGEQTTVDALQRIAAAYEQHKIDNGLNAWPRVGYNDISLPFGGIFDISGHWRPSHHQHRLGRNVDFRLGFNAAQRAVLRGLITGEGAAILDEGDHWHLTF